MRNILIPACVLALFCLAACDLAPEGGSGGSGSGSAALAINTSTLPNCAYNTSYYQVLSACGGTTPYSWSLVTGWLPGNMQLTAAGEITGDSQSSVGTFSFRVRVTDAMGANVDRQLSLTVNVPSAGATPVPIPLMILDDSAIIAPGGPFNHAMTAIGGAGNYTWSITAGTLSARYSFSTTGTFSHANVQEPQTADNLTLQVTDSAGASVSKDFVLVGSPVYAGVPSSSSAEVVILQHSADMATIDAGQTSTRLVRAAQDLMRHIAALESAPIGNFAAYFQIILCGNNSAAFESAGFRGTSVSDKLAAILSLANLTPAGGAPMYSAALLAQSAHTPWPYQTLAIYSGGAFGADSAAPGGVADYANVLAQFSGWVGTNSENTDGLDYWVEASHTQFMQDFAALGATGSYSAP